MGRREKERERERERRKRKKKNESYFSFEYINYISNYVSISHIYIYIYIYILPQFPQKKVPNYHIKHLLVRLFGCSGKRGGQRSPRREGEGLV